MQGFFGLLIMFLTFAGMVAHIWVTVATNWAAMLILGLVFFPVGVVHGWGIILGVW